MVKRITAWLLVLVMAFSFPSWIFADTQADDPSYEGVIEEVIEDADEAMIEEEPAYDDSADQSQNAGEDSGYTDSEDEANDAAEDVNDAAEDVNDAAEDVNDIAEDVNDTAEGVNDVSNTDEGEEQNLSGAGDTSDSDDHAIDAASSDATDIKSDEQENGDGAAAEVQASDVGGNAEIQADSQPVTAEIVETETVSDVANDESTAQEDVEEEDEEEDDSSSSGSSTSVEGVPVRDPDPVEINVYVTEKGIRPVSQEKAYALKDINVYEEKDSDSRVVGTLGKYGVCYILSDEGSGWYYVESGKVRGFALSESLSRDDDIPIPEGHPDHPDNKKVVSFIESPGMQGDAMDSFRELAQPAVDPSENSAYLYMKASAQRTVANRIYGITKNESAVYDAVSEDALTVGTVAEGGLVYILQRGGKDFLFIESGEVRGFISKDGLKYGEDIQKEVEEKGEDNYSLADAVVSAEENKAYYYSLKSADLRTPSGSVKESVDELIHSLDGVMLKNLASDDESFAGLICRSYGFDAGDDIEDYKKAGDSVESAGTGDILIFTENEETAEKVAIYAGDGEMLSSEDGVLRLMQLEDQNIVSRRHVIKDTRTLPASKDIREANAPEENYGTYLGNFYLTYYCPCALCCDEATGLTATGVIAAEGETIAVDPSVIPYGTKVIVNGHIFTAQDCGGGVKGNHIDIFVPYHSMCDQEIVRGEVYLLK